ncbi:aminodeoxychorismate synthase component I [Alteromonas lipolytica]|uniref:aminodeoxychorismate synthase n=1 Tax=Alteromonas lipolytica TaxID=1856405 RepID=A0A1E8FI28_9ALTE|nr:aminodeoxychorismate synthase component I [Alteromonas lipolytica]OFI35133.1 aminodeoxychorismate synthase, component I [Alteromonas lipolytica]GGF56978.1 aminodeoxychorismate synthase, component I [Alteromonas lipolytica]
MPQPSFSFAPAALCITPVELPANATIQDVFQSVAEDNWSLLYDSSNSTQSNSRYDIALWAPLLRISSKNGTTSVHNQSSCIETITTAEERPLATARRYLTAFQQSTDYSAVDQTLFNRLPLVVGLAGICSYDLGRDYETLPAVNPNEYQCPDMALGIYAQALIHDVTEGRWYFCHRNDVPVPDFNQWLQQSALPFAVKESWQSNLSRDQYVSALAAVHNYLVAGDCYQVNFAQRFNTRYEGSLWTAYRTLTRTNRVPFSAYMRVDDSHILSLSPERFIQCRDGIIETKPIKGTRPRFDDPQQDKASAENLLSAEKDRAENLMIVDLLRNDISKHSVPGSVQVPELFKLESYPAVHHMVTKITSRLAPHSHPLDLLAGCFPGGSITGAPKIRAMEIIEELEPNRRSIYCGSFLYLGLKNDLDSSICIRTLLGEHNALYCWAGGGIVLDSDAAEEYQETFDKVARILPVLGSVRE